VSRLEHLLLSDLQESGGFGETLSQEPVGVLVLPPLPGMAGLGETGLALEFFCEGFMPGKLLSVVKGEGVDEVLESFQQGDDGFGDRLGGLPVHGPGEPEFGFPFVEGDQGSLMALSDHGVGLPVSEALPAVGRFGPGLNAHPVGNATGTARAAAALSILLSMTAQVQGQVATRTLVFEQVLMDRLMRDRFLALLLQASCNLFRAPVLPQQAPDARLHRRRHLDGLRLDRMALLSLVIGLLVAMAPESPVAGKLPADTRLGATQGPGDPVPGDSQLPLGLNINALFKGKVVAGHKAYSVFDVLEIP